MVFSHLFSFNESSAEGVYLFLPLFEKENGLFMLSFATDGFGNLICEEDGKSIFWRHETEEFELVADSIEELMNSLHS